MRRAAIVLLGSIGDVARALPLAAILKSAGVERLSWIVEPKSAALPQLNRYVDRVVVFDRAAGFRSVRALLHELRSEPYDVVLDLQRHLKSGIISWLSGCKRRIGFHRRDTKEFNWLFNSETIEEFGEHSSKVLHYLRFAERLKLNIPDKLDFGLIAADGPPGNVTIPKRSCALVLGSSWESKDWHTDGYRQLLEIMDSDVTAVLVGDRSQRDRAAKLRTARRGNQIVDLVGETSLRGLVGVLSQVSIGIGPDSGPGHILAALGRPYVALIGPTERSRVVPYGCEELSLSAAIACAPCRRRVCPGVGQICMRLISPEAVWAKARIAMGISSR